MEDRPADQLPGLPPPGRGVLQFKLATLFAIMALAAVAFWQLHHYLNNPPPVDWVPYSQTLFDKEVKAGKTVLVDFRAGWSNYSALIEKTTWSDPSLLEEFRQRRVVLMVVDFTKDNPAGFALLEAVPATSFPLVTIYRGGSLTPCRVLRDIVTAEQVIDALREP